MADFTYDFKKEMKGAHIGACHYAVRSLILGKKKGLSTAELQRRWRFRVMDMAKIGWKSAAGKSMQYLRNCPPYSVSYGDDRKIHRCKCPRVCPMCFARDVVREAYRAIEYSFYEDPRSLKEDFTLVGVRRVWNFDDWRPKKRWADLLDQMSEYRNYDRDRFKKGLGACTLVLAEPNKEDLQVTRATIVVVPVGDDTKLPDELQVRWSESITKKNIAKAIGWAFRYPRGMMYGDPAVTLKILTGLEERKMRLLKTSGCMFNKRMRAAVR